MYTQLEQQHSLTIGFKELTLCEKADRYFYREVDNTQQAIRRWARENQRTINMRFSKDEGLLYVEVLD